MITKETERKQQPTRQKAASPAPQRRRPAQNPAQTAPVKHSPQRKAPAKPERAEAAPDVVFLPPKPFHRNRLLLQLGVVLAVVLAFLMGVSVFFKVDYEKTTVSGCVMYSANDILKASGIQDGDHLLTFNRAQVAGKIISSLLYVDSVHISIKLPDTVTIVIVEAEVPYAIQAKDHSWWLISAGGKVMEKAADSAEAALTKIYGLYLLNPVPGEPAAVFEPTDLKTDADGKPIPVTTTQAQRLSMALRIVENLQQNGILGQVTKVDVNNLGDIQLWCGQQYQVKLGDESQLAYKISCLKSVLDNLGEYQSGVLDITFTTWPDKIGLTPFDSNSATFLQKNAEN